MTKVPKSCSINLLNFMRDLITAAEASIPSSNSFSLSTHNPWWNDDCKLAKREKNRARRRYIKSKDPCDLIDYKRLKAKARQIYNSAQKKSWQEYVSKINSETSVTQIWKRVNKLRGKHKGSHVPSLRYNGDILNEPSRVAECLAESLSESSKGLATYDPVFAAKKLLEDRKPVTFTPSGTPSYNQFFSIEELKAALSECSDSAPGEDRITFSMLKNLQDEALHTLLCIYNKIWQILGAT